jgi:hypothetical protein
VGFPVVVPLTQGFCNTVTHAEDGFLFKPGDTEDAVSYLRRLQKDPKLRTQMGAAALKKVKKNTVESVVENLHVWYRVGRQRERGQECSVPHRCSSHHGPDYSNWYHRPRLLRPADGVISSVRVCTQCHVGKSVPVLK